ncbi:MAG: L,D-transpeptidase [Actinomycetota bacterium]
MGEDGSAIHRLKSAGPRIVVMVIAFALGLALLEGLSAILHFPTEQTPGDTTRSKERPRDLHVPEPVAPAFAASDPYPIRPDKWDSVWGVVKRRTDVHARPALDSRVVGRLGRVTPEGTDNIVLILDRETALEGRLWVRVLFPSLPNGGAGWVARDTIGGYGVVHTRLVIDLSLFSARLYERGRVLFDAPIGIGKPKWPTPVGVFYVRNRLAGFGDPIYGPVAFGTSARSVRLTDWPAGGFVGIHGTNTPELIPGRVSHGCVRMRNDDILELDRLMPVGTPVTIRP